MENENFSPNNGEDVTITISIGVTEYLKGEEISSFVERADKAMYMSKGKGRNTVSTILT